MLTLSDGRKELYQWDTERKATVDVECDLVHFSNLKYGVAIPVDVIDGAVNIPDELLQTGATLYCWAFVGTVESGYTRVEGAIEVNKRPKPSDYVFTPTEQITLNKVMLQIGNLENLNTKNKENLVEAINEIFNNLGNGGTGQNGVGISKIEQTTTSTVSSGINVITVTLTDGRKYTFEVRNGAQGEKGDKGDRGEQGIQGIQGAKGETGAQGQKGADGTPATHRWSGTTLYITSASGTSSANLKGEKGDKGDKGDTGAAGKDGANGKTPVRGTDYWTDTDKTDMLNDVLAALPTWNGGSY